MSCIDYDKRLYVYWNISKKTWSVRQSGKVVGHSDLIFLKDCRFLVAKAGQARVRREKKKNVHAGVSGYLFEDPLTVDRIAWNDLYDYTPVWVMYNPYKHDTFVQRDHQFPAPVTESEFAKMYILNGKPVVGAVEPCG